MLLFACVCACISCAAELWVISAQFLTLEASAVFRRQLAQSGRCSTLRFNSTGIAEFLGRVETLQEEKDLLLLCNFPWLKSVWCCLCASPIRTGWEQEHAPASFSCFCRREISEKGCVRAWENPWRGTSQLHFPADRGVCLEKCPEQAQSGALQGLDTGSDSEVANSAKAPDPWCHLGFQTRFTY